MMTTNEKRELKYETKEGRSIVGKDYETPRTALEGIRDQDLIGTVHVQLEYLRKHSQNVSELVVAEGLDTALRHNDIIDLSNATRFEAGEACDYIFVWGLNKYEKVGGVVESVISTNNTRGHKIILEIQRIEKTWKIAFALDGVTCPRGNETYADEAIQLLREAIVRRTVEVELRNLIDPIDMDGYFVGTLRESNTDVAIPLLQAGLAKLESPYKLEYSSQLTDAQKPAKMKKLKIWENYDESSSSNNN